MEKEALYTKLFVIANYFLVFSIIMVAVYLAIPLLGGKLSVSALMHYGSWICLAVGMRILSRRRRKGLRIRIYEYSLAYLFAVINFVIWFSYPINMILSILGLAGFALDYRAQEKNRKTSDQDKK